MDKRIDIVKLLLHGVKARWEILHLKKNRAKGPFPRDLDLLFEYLDKENFELYCEVQYDNVRWKRVRDEASDVGNYADMIIQLADEMLETERKECK